MHVHVYVRVRTCTIDMHDTWSSWPNMTMESLPEFWDFWERFLHALNEDLYLRLSVYGVVVLFVLCVLIVLSWSRYGTTISAMFDSKSVQSQN